MNAISRLYRTWAVKPTAVTLPTFLIPIGIAALILGDNVSAAFTNLGGGTIIRCMGASMALGGILVITSIIRNDALAEVIGLALAALGAAIYGAGVITGLQLQGIVAGLGYLGMTVAFLGRILLLLRAAGRTCEHRHRPRRRRT